MANIQIGSTEVHGLGRFEIEFLCFSLQDFYINLQVRTSMVARCESATRASVVAQIDHAKKNSLELYTLREVLAKLDIALKQA